MSEKPATPSLKLLVDQILESGVLDRMPVKQLTIANQPAPDPEVEQKPVAWLRKDAMQKLLAKPSGLAGFGATLFFNETELHTEPLYAAPETEALRKEIEILKALNEHLQKENQSFYESDDHEFQAIYQDLIRDLGIPFGGSVIETVNKIQSQNARLMRTLHFVERCANHHGQNPKISAAEVLSMIQHYPDIEDITKAYADGVVPDTPNPYAELADVLNACKAVVSAFDALSPSSAARTEPLQINVARAAIEKAEGFLLGQP